MTTTLLRSYLGIGLMCLAFGLTVHVVDAAGATNVDRSVMVMAASEAAAVTGGDPEPPFDPVANCWSEDLQFCNFQATRCGTIECTRKVQVGNVLIPVCPQGSVEIGSSGRAGYNLAKADPAGTRGRTNVNTVYCAKQYQCLAPSLPVAFGQCIELGNAGKSFCRQEFDPRTELLILPHADYSTYGDSVQCMIKEMPEEPLP